MRAICHGRRVNSVSPPVPCAYRRAVEIRKADLGDPALADAWYGVYARADRFERPFAAPWLRPEISEQYVPNLRRDASAWAGVVDGHIVCVGTIELSLLDNTHSATLRVYTDPPQRRRGYGSAMLQHLEGLAREAGRRTSYLEAHYPLDAPADGKGSVAADFATAQGYTFGLGDIMRSLPLPVPERTLLALSAEAEPHHEDYRLEVLSGRIPDRWVEDYVALEAGIATESPMGDLEIEAFSTAVEPYREGEERIARQGRVSYHALALHGEEVVGYTTVTVARSDRSKGYQWGTLVSGRHRGHRLGLALKVANLRQVQRHEPDMASIITWNAEANGPMISVNEQLGYVAVERLGEFEKRW